MGRIVVAWVVLHPREAVTEAALIAFVRTRLADYKAPEHIVFVSDLPKGPTGKIQRRPVRELELDRVGMSADKSLVCDR